MTRWLVVCFIVLLSSCSSIPLGTMLEFRSFSKDDLAKIQPLDLRAKIQLDEPVKADIGSAELTLNLATPKGERSFSFPLILLDEHKVEPVKGFFSTSAGKTEYTLKLSEEAVSNFVAVQQIIRDEPTGSLAFSVSSGLEQIPDGITEVSMSIFLKLSEEKGFITLFDNAKLEFKQGS